jgi:AraC family transcriptional regulator of adaptative response/methylated-DNA-[protein]-cysteine methyltransferase
MQLTVSAMYRAVVERNADYDGAFYVGVKTTGVFCRTTCPGRPPLPENCEYFATAQEALLASYRPCKRCRPLSHPNETTDLIRRLVALVEAEPDRRWRAADLRAEGVEASTARRQFKERFGMTFVEYARARRLGEAFKAIRAGERVILAQVDAGYSSGSGFRDAFAKILGAPPSSMDARLLFAAWFDTPVGAVTAIADEDRLYLLEYVDRRGLEGQIVRLRRQTGAGIAPGRTQPIEQIDRELAAYFRGDLKKFETPLARIGTPFQQAVWESLLAIPFGETRSYREVARAAGKPDAVRAAASANGANPFAIVVPCHRVIGADGGLGGYGGGLSRKRWLLDHEQRIAGAIRGEHELQSA